MKILIYTHEYPPFLGGLATTSYKLATGLASRDDMEIFILAPSYGTGDKNVDKEFGDRILRVPLLKTKITKFIPFLLYLISSIFFYTSLKKIKPDIVLFITEEAEATGGIVSIFCEFTSIARVAGSGITTCFLGNKPFKKLLKYPIARLYKISKKIIAVSNYSKDLLLQIGINREKIIVINNGISEELISKSPESEKLTELKKMYSIKSDEKILLTIARILPRKGQDNVIKALKLVDKQYSNFKYLIVGTGRYENEFRDLARSLGLEDKVIFTGGVDHSEIIYLLDICDVFILANRNWNNKIEGLPNAVLEASARAKPVIVGNYSGSVESVIDGKTGLLVDSDNIIKVSQSILNLFSDRHKSSKFGKEGKKMIESRFTEEIMIDKYYSLFMSYKK